MNDNPLRTCALKYLGIPVAVLFCKEIESLKGFEPNTF